jgi:hypothetical protein
MNYLSDEKTIDWCSLDCTDSWLLEFSPDKSDYFLNYRLMWNKIYSQVFTFNVNNQAQIQIPSGFFVLIGDVYGVLDWIMVDEMIGRPIETIILSEDQHAWSLRVLEFDSVEDKEFYWPNTKNIIPMSNGDGHVIMISDKDQHHKTKNEIINSFIV